MLQWITILRGEARKVIEYTYKLLSSVNVKVFKLNYEFIIKKLRECKRALEKDAIAVILIDSLARGDYTVFSDADIVIVVPNDYSKKFLDRIPDFIDPTLPIDIEPRVYTKNEILRLAEKSVCIVKEIVDYDIIIAGDRNVVEKR